MKTFYDYRAKNCTEKGDQPRNLSPKEIRGLRKLRKRVQNKSIVVLKTDKSGKMTVMKRELKGEQKNVIFCIFPSSALLANQSRQLGWLVLSSQYPPPGTGTGRQVGQVLSSQDRAMS